MGRVKELYIELMEKLMDEQGLSYEQAGEVAYQQLQEVAQTSILDREIEID